MPGHFSLYYSHLFYHQLLLNAVCFFAFFVTYQMYLFLTFVLVFLFEYCTFVWIALLLDVIFLFLYLYGLFFVLFLCAVSGIAKNQLKQSLTYLVIILQLLFTHKSYVPTCPH